jgi:hypothetical protein
MKKTRRRLSLPLVLLAPVLSVAASLSLIWLFPGLLNLGQTHSADALSPAEKRLLEAGDLILIRGTGYTGDLILLALAEPVGLSHCGIIVLRETGPWVIHTISPGLSGIDGVQAHTLDGFTDLSRAASVIVVRPRWGVAPAASTPGASVALRAQLYLDQAVPFDNVFDFEKRDKLYCTELLYQVLADGGFWNGRNAPVLKGGVLGFNTFLDPESFTVIINHQEQALAH